MVLRVVLRVVLQDSYKDNEGYKATREGKKDPIQEIQYKRSKEIQKDPKRFKKVQKSPKNLVSLYKRRNARFL